ncbi:carbohydrate kinase family protein [Pelagibius sp. Alg239-R121]|uniref:carbohydrate kinase family protein n=1 Tax=Pelagibius sp. Alg239-R121 TaxID=2993448 RepID=UPI0024A68EC0|nr:carbohydrate kinase family protein [Pelagibius sp. Alg239-R121]
MARFFCFGGAHFDRTARCKTTFLSGASNPVAVTSSLGGAALNTAFNLKRLDGDVSLISILGDDAAGESVARAMSSLGLARDGLIFRAHQATATYTAILDREGSLVAGLADMDIYEDVLAAECLEALNALPHVPKAGDYAFLDCNLPEVVLADLTEGLGCLGVKIAVAAISPAKLRRLVSSMDRIDFLFCNIAELAALTAQDISDDAALSESAKHISSERNLTLFVTRGAKGVKLFDRGTPGDYPAAAAEVIDVNGAGDAFAAGTLSALARQRTLAQAIFLGQAAAALTLEISGSTTPGLSWDALQARLSKA